MAQTSGTIYVRDPTPSGTYAMYLHVYDNANGGAEVAGSPVFLGYATPNMTNPWSGGPTLPDDSTPRWIVRIEVINGGQTKNSYYPSFLTTEQYFAGGLNMPSVSFD